MRLKNLTGAIAAILAMGTASAAEDTAAQPDLKLGPPEIRTQRPAAEPAHEAAQPDLRLGSPDVRSQGPEGEPAPQAAQPDLQLGPPGIREQGGETAAGPRLDFDALDANDDGYISKSEAQQQFDAEWANIDLDRDGRIEKAEISAYDEQEQRQASEAEAAMPDLKYGSPEVRTQGPEGEPAHQAAMPDLKLGSPGVRRQGPEAEPAPEAAQPDLMLGLSGLREDDGEPARFEEVDRDNDGYIDKSEAQERFEANWAQVDRDGDGRVDEAEFSAFVE